MGVRIYPDVPRVYFDADGTLFDFVGAAQALGMAPSDFKRHPGAFVYLRPTPGSREAVREVLARGYSAFVLTKISKSNPYSAAEKILSLQREFPEFEDHIILSPDKGAVGQSRDYLVDDMPLWANADKFPGTVLHYRGDWSSILQAIPDLPSRKAANE